MAIVCFMAVSVRFERGIKIAPADDSTRAIDNGREMGYNRMSAKISACTITIKKGEIQ